MIESRHDRQNPFESPKSRPVYESRFPYFWVFACAAGIIAGWLLAHLLAFTVALAYGQTDGLRQTMYKAKDVSGMAFGLSYVFGAAALINYLPKRQIGLTRATAMVGAFLILGAFVADLISRMFGLGAETYSVDKWRWLRTTICLFVPTLYVFFHLAWFKRAGRA